MEYDPDISNEELMAANRRHDEEMRRMGLTFDCRVRSAWNESALIKGKILTDKKILKYENLGFYSAEYRQLRKDKMAARKMKRRGNFVELDGAWIYCPI